MSGTNFNNSEIPDGGISGSIKQRLHEHEDLCAAVEKLAERTDRQAAAEKLEELKRQWDNLPELTPEYYEILNKKFCNACEAFSEAAVKAEEKSKLRAVKVDQLGDLCVKIARLTVDQAAPDKKIQLQRLRKEWRKISEDVQDIEVIEKSFEASCAKIDEQIKIQEKAKIEALDSLRQCRDDLQELAEQEKPDEYRSRKAELDESIKQAAELLPDDKQAAKLLEDCRKAGRKYAAKLHQIYQTRDLARWEHYALKVALCEKAEELTKFEDKDLPRAAKLLKQLRIRWKGLGSVPHEKSGEIWEQFKSIVDPLQQRIRDYYDHLEEQRREIFTAKEQLCAQAEEMSGNTDWKKTAEEFKQLQKKWREAGFTQPEHERALYERFRAACDIFFNAREKHFQESKKQREDATGVKKQLCEEAEELEKIHYGDAHRKIPGLWQRWKQAGSAGRDDHALYERFRGAFDKYYSSLRSQRTENLKEKQIILEQLEALAARPEDEFSPDEAQSSYRQLSAQWDAVGPIPRSDEQAIMKKFTATADKVKQRLGDLRRAKEKNTFKCAFQFETIVGKAFSALETGGGDQAAILKQEWEAVNGSAVPEVDKTFKSIIAALENGNAAIAEKLRREMDKNLRKRKMICIELEKLGGSSSEDNVEQDSGALLAEELTMAIAGNFAAAAPDNRLTPEKVRELTSRWLKGGVVPEQELESLCQRFERALDQLQLKLAE